MPRTSSVTTRRSARLPRAQSQPAIQSFARTTKPGLPLNPLPEKDGKNGVLGLPVSPSKKRKLHELENVNYTVRDKERETNLSNKGISEDDAENIDLSLTPSKSLKFSSLSVSSPRSGHYAPAAGSATPASGLSPSRSTRLARAENTGEDAASPATPTKRAVPTPSSKPKTPKAIPCSNSTPNLSVPARPSCVVEMVRLHSAFLKALTIHAAHKGVVAPADLREFLPSVERIWKKRKVVVKDVQRILWIWKQSGAFAASGSAFRLANHGLGRVCLERTTGRAEKLDDEVESQAKFEAAVDTLWAKASEAHGAEFDFMGTLGLVPIEESLAPFTAFRKGQQRLQDLKGGVMKVKMGTLLAEASEEGAKSSSAKLRDATTSRRQGLLDRIKNKEVRQTKLPPPPSKEALLRRAAAGRIEEVAGVLALLRPAGYVGNGPMARMAAQRTPFCLDTVIQNVQDSTRNPISEKEVEACLEILSREDIAGHWVSIVAANQLKSVVLRSCGDVQLKELGNKVAQLKPWEESPEF